MVRKLLTLFLLISISGVSYAQKAGINKADSLQYMRKTIRKNKLFRATIVPVSLFAAGAIAMSGESHTLISKQSFQSEFLEENYNPTIHWEDYTRDLPIVAVYGLNLAGVKGRNNFMERTIILGKAMLIQHILVTTLKRTINIERPDGGNSSFPSSHTARAFMAATFMHYEYGQRSIWYSIGAYSSAVFTGYMRVRHNHHWVNDVLVGAGIGILSTNIAYITHKYKWTTWRTKRKNTELVLTPIVGPGYAGITFTGKIK